MRRSPPNPLIASCDSYAAPAAAPTGFMGDDNAMGAMNTIIATTTTTTTTTETFSYRDEAPSTSRTPPSPPPYYPTDGSPSAIAEQAQIKRLVSEMIFRLGAGEDNR